ncbi:putative phage tail protein [Lachnospiraceae bacterium KK002]
MNTVKKTDMADFPDSESAKRQLSYVTEGFYDNSYVGKWLFQVMGLEYDDARRILEELPRQFFPETATWGLMYHEMKWGLPVRENLPYEERRKLIFRKRDFKAPMTPRRMETYFTNLLDFQVRVSDIHDAGKYGFVPEHPNIFRADFTGDGTLDAKAVKSVLDSLKQSHTVYIINDRVIIEVDNREPEKYSLSGMKVTVACSFWKKDTVDGSICPDRILRRLHMGIRQGAAVAGHQEKVEASAVFRKNEWYLDGTYRMDGTKEISAEITEEVL